MAMATGEAPAEVAVTELPEIVKTVQEAVSLSMFLEFNYIFLCISEFRNLSDTNDLLLVSSGRKWKINMQCLHL